jgi:hypothetical protein
MLSFTIIMSHGECPLGRAVSTDRAWGGGAATSSRRRMSVLGPQAVWSLWCRRLMMPGHDGVLTCGGGTRGQGQQQVTTE